jgi:hypothetical protein
MEHLRVMTYPGAGGRGATSPRSRPKRDHDPAV